MIMLHITGACSFQTEEWWTTIMWWTYFFMSFFFFKAGYFNKTVSGKSWEYCKDKFKRLMIPYFVWGAIGNAIYFFFAWFILEVVMTVSVALVVIVFCCLASNILRVSPFFKKYLFGRK